MREIDVPIDAARVCAAIARIGYEPHSALMDIVDNSIAAGAKNVSIRLELVEGKTISQRNNVLTYRVVDDGSGMDAEGLKNALRLGSAAAYEPNSLSKYGMGLKSAGLSLGRRIQLVSKRDSKLSAKHFLDTKVIQERGKYVVCVESLSREEIKYYEALIPGSSGTVVEIFGCGEIYHTSAKTTIERLKHRLGVTYFPFLANGDTSDRLNITLSFPGEPEFRIEPLDFLFTQDTADSYDPSSYQGDKPCYAERYEWKVNVAGSVEVPPVKIEVVTFPKDAMGRGASPLSDDTKAKIRAYRVSRENKGFFIYRNGRLIRWGDDLDDIVGKDLIGLRARMELSTAHDDLLHVDVSKQRIEMDDETRSQLDLMMRLPRRQAEAVFKKCDEILRTNSGEGVQFSESANGVPEEDPVEEIAPPDRTEKKKRAKRQEEDSKKTLESVGDATTPCGGQVPPPSDKASESFLKIRYVDEIPDMNLWSAQKDPVNGTFVLINRKHAFYQSVISSLQEGAPARLALEALIFCSAVGENKTYENLTSVSENHIREVVRRYGIVMSYNLMEWASQNQHIFDS